MVGSWVSPKTLKTLSSTHKILSHTVRDKDKKRGGQRASGRLLLLYIPLRLPSRQTDGCTFEEPGDETFNEGEAGGGAL